MATLGVMKMKILENIIKRRKKIYYKKVIVIIYMLRTFIKNNKTLVSIVLFLIIFCIVQMIKPGFLYNKDSSLREFGIGYKNKTILPLWLFSIILGILIYVFVLYYFTYFHI
jgi:hypothetical protein